MSQHTDFTRHPNTVIAWPLRRTHRYEAIPGLPTLIEPDARKAAQSACSTYPLGTHSFDNTACSNLWPTADYSPTRLPTRLSLNGTVPCDASISKAIATGCRD